MKLTNIISSGFQLSLQGAYNKTIEYIDKFIDDKNIRTILLTTTVILFSIYCTLNIWNARIVKSDDIVEIYIPSDSEISQPLYTPEELITETFEVIQPTSEVTKKRKTKRVTESIEATFIKDFSKSAISESKIYKIPASIKIAQAALESGWGEDEIAIKYNNFYGMKYKKEFSEDEKSLVLGRINRKTKEYVKGKIKATKDDFAVYATRWNSIRQHSEFLRDRIDSKFNAGYASMSNIPNKKYRKWARALEKAGYSSNPNYAETLIKIIEEYKLYKYDKRI